MKKLITKMLFTTFFLLLIVTLSVNYYIQTRLSLRDLEESSGELLWQVEQIIQKNEEEIAETKKDFADICLIRANAAAYIAEHYPAMVDDREEAKKVAALLQVDELHFFDVGGTIVSGTNPEYYGYHFNSGKQMQFFLPMLEDHSLELCQDITPNTAELKLMQYAAVWRKDEKGIVQIGLEPHRVLEVMEKNTLTNIFSMITSNKAAALYAINPETQEILGSTRAGETGKLASELGIRTEDLSDDKIHSMTINGMESYCIGRKAGSVLLLRSNLKKTIQKQILVNTLLLSAYFLVMCVIILTAIYLFLDRRITKAFANVNQKLDEVEKGDTGVSFAETATPEFATLCDHINAMKKSIMDYPQKLSRSLEAARIHIGVIESVPGYKRVIVTPEVKDFLQITAEELHALSLRPELFWEKKDGLFRRAADIGDGILQLPGPEEQYVKEERFSYGGSNIQVLIDVTKSVLEKKKLEVERDTDQMTGIYNRRAFFARLNELFQKPDSLGQAALCVMDLDNLKHINDFYGHEYGDKYLLAMAAVLKENQSERALAARLGGDEFILFFHGFADETSLNAAIDTVRNTRKTRVIHLPDGAVCGLKFSMGTAYYPKEGLNSPELIRMADERMYQEKKIRKS